MTLLDLIRTPASRLSATAIPAIPATPAPHAAAPVARIATVAVASPRNARTDARAAPTVIPQPSPALLTAATDLADLIFAYTGRMAICWEAGDVADDAAHRIATEECGASLDELTARQIAYWHYRIEALPTPADRRLTGIKTTCLEALAQRWAFDATRLGWDECEMFGLDPNAPASHDRNGLLTGLALTAFRRPVGVVEINASEAVIVTASGSRRRHFNAGRAGPPIWEHPAFRRLH